MNGTVICASAGFIVNVILAVLLFHKSSREQGRVAFGCFTLYFALSSLYYILRGEAIHINNGDPFSYPVLSSGVFVTALFLIFPLQVLLPSHFHKWWVTLLVFSPFVAINAIWITLRSGGMQVLHLNSPQAILSQLNDGSVILRIVFFCFIVLFFLSSILFMIWAHKRYMTDKVLRVYAYSTIPIMVTYVFIITHGLTESLYMTSMYIILAFNTLISYLLFFSFQVIEVEKGKEAIETEISIRTAGDAEMKEYELKLLYQLDQSMETDKLYRSSELSLPELAKILGTNRTKLSDIIRCKGFTNFSTYLNSYRLQEFNRIMSANGNNTIFDAASQAGFGSKASLYRCFVSIYGVSPTEYLKNQQAN